MLPLLLKHFSTFPTQPISLQGTPVNNLEDPRGDIVSWLCTSEKGSKQNMASLCAVFSATAQATIVLFFSFVLTCHIAINPEDRQSTRSKYSCLSFNRLWKQRASLKDCWARKNLIEGYHCSPLRFVFSWVYSQTVISPFVPPAKSMVYKSSQKTCSNSLSSLQQVWVFL